MHLGPGGGLASYSGGAALNCHICLRHGEVKNQVAGASGVLQVVEDLNVTASLPILGAGRDWCLRTQVRLALGPPLGNRTQNARERESQRHT